MKKTVVCLIVWIVALSLNPFVTAQEKTGGKETDHAPVIVFVCEHGAARSIVSAAHFNKLAEERGLSLRAIARGTNPDKEIPSVVSQGLKADGLVSGEAAPKKISQADLVGAQRVIAFCELPDEYPGRVKVEHWDGVPPMGEDYNKARAWLVERINRLLEELKSERLRP